MKWYVIKAINGREDRARDGIEANLKARGMWDRCEELLIPVERVTEMKRGKRVQTRRKLYPGYIYGQLDLNHDMVEVIRSIDGVTGFLAEDPVRPDPLTDAEMEQVLKIARAQSPDEQRAAMVQIPYNVGDVVRVKEGTFAGMSGDVEEINEAKGLVRVIITVFGRQTPVELEVWQVEEEVN